MTIKDILTDESKWHKGDLAVNSKGVDVSPDDPDACKFCLLGALKKAYGDNEEEYPKKLSNLYEANNFEGIIGFNDHPSTTFADVMALVEKAGV